MNLHTFKYSDTEQKQILKSLTMLIDTREQSNTHITAWLKSKGMSFKSQKLSYGDYSFMIPACAELGINRDMYFDNSITIERKNSLEELSGNLAQHRERFENEWLRAGNTKKILLIEKGSFEDILQSNYQTKFNAGAYLASLLSFQHRYGINISFVPKEYAGQFIYCQFYYYLRELLR